MSQTPFCFDLLIVSVVLLLLLGLQTDPIITQGNYRVASKYIGVCRKLYILKQIV